MCQTGEGVLRLKETFAPQLVAAVEECGSCVARSSDFPTCQKPTFYGEMGYVSIGREFECD